MESFSIQYASGMEVPIISKRVKQNAEKALQLDSLNLRAYYVLGSNDFYTPEQYGGGKKAEKYLLKAIKLNDQSLSNPYLPSWGKNSAYEILIRLYINHKQFAEAKKYFQEALTLFPDDYMINKLANELINH
jgi:pentatricopeptide repeat protein